MASIDAQSISTGTSPIEITTDEWGVDHIAAGSASDVFYGQGYSAAHARLFQMELWRLRGLGRLATTFGAEYVDLDIAARTFLYRGSVEDELDCYGPEARDAVDSFVSGVNHAIADVLADSAGLPLEFRAAGFAPSPWSAEDIVRVRLHGLHTNAEEEIARAATLRDFGTETEDLRKPREPFQPVVVPPGLDLDDIDPSVLAVYRLAHSPFAIPGSAAASSSAALDGSNNWAIAGSRTASGRPILATDPHRILGFPTLRTVVHLICPEFDAIGMNEPYMPGVSGGHNADIAFGFTIAPTDVEDVYVYDIDESGERYRYLDGWVEFDSITETIEVAGEDPRTVNINFTRHGPVLHLDQETRKAYALRALWLQAGMTPYLGSLAYLRARSVDEFLGALEVWGAPALNHVVADTSGRIAWQVAGRSPVRPNWDGLLPVPGDGSYEWNGVRTAPDLPGIADPANGWVRSANQWNLAEDPDWTGAPYSYEWYAGHRAARIAEALDAEDRWTIAATAALQNDYLSGSAVEATELFAKPFADADAEFARHEIHAWNKRMTADSRAAAIFDRWLYRHVHIAIAHAAASRIVTPERRDAAAQVIAVDPRKTVGDPRVTLALLRECASWEQTDAFPGQHVLLERTLAAAVRDLRAEFGDPATWRWGRLQGVRLTHPLHGAEGLDPALTDTGRSDKPGSSDTVGLAYGADGLQTVGASTRLVMDVGDWDASVFISMPGIAGDITSPHARDLFPLWLADATVPLVFTPEAIAAHAESVRTVIRRDDTEVAA